MLVCTLYARRAEICSSPIACCAIALSQWNNLKSIYANDDISKSLTTTLRGYPGNMLLGIFFNFYEIFVPCAHQGRRAVQNLIVMIGLDA